MIPSRLTIFKESRTADGEERVTTESVYGQAETPPIPGTKFVLMTNDTPPVVVKTGYIRHVDGIFRDGVNRGDVREASGCIFYCDNSTYRWDREESENIAPIPVLALEDDK